MEAIDLSQFLPDDTAELELCVPGTSHGTGWKVTFAGPGHPKSVEQSQKATKRLLRRKRDIEAAQVNGKKWRGEDQTPEEATRENIEWVVGRIVSWTPVKIAKFSDQPIQFSEPVAVDLLSKPYMGGFLLQMIDFITADQSFTKASATI